MHQGAISLCMLDLPSCIRQLSHQTLLIEFWGNRIKRPYFYRECDGACISYHLSYYYLILHSHSSCLYVLAYQKNIWWYNVQAKYLCALCMSELKEMYLNRMSLIPVSLMGFPLLLFISSSLPPLPLSLVADSADISLSSSPAFLNAWSLRFCKIIKENT